MSKTMWKGGAFEYPIPAVLITCGTMDEPNVMTAAWTGIINTKPQMVYVSIRPERYSYDIIRENMEFVINLTNEKLVYATDWCGVKSGAKFDKFKEMHLTKEKANFVKCPSMFMAEVLSIDPDTQYINDKGEFDISKCNLIAYANGGYYSLGKKLGKFGYSVQKKKNR